MHILDPVKHLDLFTALNECSELLLQDFLNSFMGEWGGLCCVEEYFGSVGLVRQFLWVGVDRWRCISSGWEWVDILFG